MGSLDVLELIDFFLCVSVLKEVCGLRRASIRQRPANSANAGFPLRFNPAYGPLRVESVSDFSRQTPPNGAE
jgi:hypothetical protein